MKDEGTYIDAFGKRIEGAWASVILLAIWVMPFFVGYLLGRVHQ